MGKFKDGNQVNAHALRWYCCLTGVRILSSLKDSWSINVKDPHSVYTMLGQEIYHDDTADDRRGVRRFPENGLSTDGVTRADINARVRLSASVSSLVLTQRWTRDPFV